jgi:ParB/RepB/Spo0J family partition protein
MSDERIIQVRLDELHDSPYQPRQEYDEEALQELARSIRENGVLSPLSVRPRPAGGYEIIGGHRRSRAARIAGLAEVPCVVREVADGEARKLALLDNLSREDLLPWEEGEAYAKLIAEEGLTQAEVAKAAGKSPAHVGSRMRLAEGSGQALRQAYTRGEVGLVAMEAVVAKLPKGEVTAKECPRCRVIIPGDVDRCGACGADCSLTLAITADAQAVAAKKLKGRPGHQAAEVVAQIAERYGLAGKPVQVSLGFNDVQLDEEVIETKTELERRLAAIGNLRDWALQHQAQLAGYQPTAREAALAQLRAGRAALRQVEDMLIGAGALELSAQ